MSIDITKLKKNTKILVETEDTVFEIKVTGPKSCVAEVHGGMKFIRPTRVTISGAIDKRALKSGGKKPLIKEKHIEKNRCIEFLYKKNGQTKDKIQSILITSKVLSATVYSPDGKWSYDAIERNKE
tara:strand:- start:2398 stop:2775 length:378 start_codon:yes stop_codon:yes gene_type:complete